MFPLPQKGNQAGIGIMKVNPLESRAAEILLEKSPLAPVEPVEIPNPPLNPLVR